MSDPKVITLLTWEQLDTALSHNLSSSLTSIRIPTLVRTRQLVDEHTTKERLLMVSNLLLLSYNFYLDEESRRQVLSTMEALVEVEPKLLSYYVKFIYDLMIPPKQLAPTDLLTLLAWINAFSVIAVANAKVEVSAASTLSQDIISAQASLLHQSVQVVYGKMARDKAARRVYISILAQTKLAIRNTLAHAKEQHVAVYVSALAKAGVHGNLCLLGLLADAVLEIAPTLPGCTEVLNSKSTEIMDFYAKDVLLAKTAPARFALALFGRFVHEFVGEAAFVDLVPHLEKANLRSSELTFGGNLVTEIFNSIDPQKFALLDAVVLKSDKIVPQIISALKSTKEETRDGAYAAVCALLTKHTGSDAAIEKLSAELFKTLKTISNVDQKVLFAHLINVLPTPSTASDSVLNQLLPIVAKDQNETSLTAFVQAFINNLLKQSRSQDTKKFTDQVITGLKDKKLNLRKVWATELGDAVYDSATENAAFVAQFIPALKTSIDEAQKAPLPTIAAKGIASAYVAMVLSKTSTSATNESLLLNPKVYSKITGSDCLWFLRALRQVPEAEISASSSAWLHFALSLTIEAQHRRLAIKFIEEIQSEYPQFVDWLIDELYNTIRNSSATDDFSIKYELVSALLSVLTSPNTSVHTIKSLLILSFYPGINIKNGWTGLCQRCNADPGQIISTNYEQILETSISEPKSSPLYGASLKAVSLASFIQPDLVPSYLVESYFKKNLHISKLNAIDSVQIAIWKADEGELVVDPLSANKKEDVIDKNSKDFETKKWEQEMRKELEKKGQQAKKKYTREEQQQVDARLKEELEIRRNIQLQVDAFTRSLDLIGELVQESNGGLVDNGAKHWYPYSVDFVLELITTVDDYSKYFGNLAWQTYLNLSQLLTSRLGETMKLFIGVATLRVYKVFNVSENYLEEPILDLISRLLFRIKFLSDAKPLDSISLSYILPLLKKVLENGKKVAIQNAASRQAVTSEFVEEDPEEEQLLLAMEIIGSHAEAFEDEFIPRTYILKELISLMKLPTRAKLAKECFLSICQHISVNINNSDLQLLLDTTIVSEVFVRTAVLEGLDSEFDLQDFAQEVIFSPQLWTAVHDNDVQCSELATAIWNENGFQLLSSVDFVKTMTPLFNNSDAGLRYAIANSIKTGINEEDIADVLTILIETFWVMEKPPVPLLDQFGLVIKTSQEQRDNWEGRSTIALAISELTPLMTIESVSTVFLFLVKDKALADKDATVRQELQEAGVTIIEKLGSKTISELIPIFDDSLASSAAAAGPVSAPAPAKKAVASKPLLNRRPLNTKVATKAKATTAAISIVEPVVILYGALARHLDESDARLRIIVERLLKTLDTSSEDVQYSVSECIAPLVIKVDKDQLSSYFDALFDNLFKEGANLRLRRGAAYGIAGIVKGSGIIALSKFDVMRTLTDASDDKKNAQRREGVSLAIYCISKLLGKFFEPYVIEVLPIILKSLGDQVPEVREATDLAARQIMKTTTSFGVKQLIPLAISNLDEIQWRSKKGSVELLGSMAYLDPTQLSASLSTIVPEIVGVLNDSHKEVRKAADQSLKRFGEVIRNPEIQTVVSDLLNAIGDPTKYTDLALDKLIKTQFVHYIDGPSLALIIHVIHRGMKDRSAATKKKACQIVGNMAFLVDGGDLKPYLSQLVGELEIAMVDPVPGTRSTAARALGSLVEKLGEEQFPELIPRLLEALQDESRASDRLGSAQALSEVVCGLGINKLEELLPEVLRNATSPRNYIRAGFMPLLLFLPVCFGSQFSPYLSKIIPPILNGLADVDEDIRDTALRAGRLIVKNYATKAVDLLLPELELGLSDENYRIRLSSVELTGDLLFQVTGISSKMVEDNNGEESDGEDEIDNTIQSSEINKALTESLGPERRDRILALLFICRSDVAGIVRAAAVDIWKALVANTPRTVKEILPTLTRFIVLRLASPDQTQRTIAAQTLGDMVRRVGTNALAQLLPTLEESLNNTSDNDAKQGICIALNELIKSSQYDALVEYQEIFIRTIREALTDPASGVREAAAQAFESLQEVLGKIVIDEILPHLLNLLKTGSDDEGVSENALLALRDIMATKSDIIFPILLPTLLAPPIDAFKATALASLASVAGPALYKRLGHVVNVMVQAIIDSEMNNETEEQQQQIKDALDSVLLAIDAEEGLHPLMQQILSLVKHEDSEKRAVIYSRLGNFFTNTNLDYSVYTQDMIAQFVPSLADQASPQIVLGSFEALSAIVKQQSKESLERLVRPTRQALSLTGVSGEDLAGFELPRGPNCILPIFLHGLMYGNSEQKELSASAIADIISKTPPANLKPFATTITGPLIRVIGEKVNSDIKAAILGALTALLGKIPQFLRPFIPQLQRTFVRSISDPSNEKLRTKAVSALGVLIEFQPRVDSLVTELVSGAKAATERAVKTSVLKGILEVVSKAGKNMSEASKTSVMSLVEEEITKVDDKSSVSYARLVGSLSKILLSSEASNILRAKILEAEEDSKKFAVLSINSFLKEAPMHIFETGLLGEIVEFILDAASSISSYISDNATVAIGKLLLLNGEHQSPKSVNPVVSENVFEIPQETVAKLIEQLSRNAVQPQSNSTDTRRLALVSIRTVARFKYDDVKDNVDVLGPSVFTCIRDPVIPIRLAAEKAWLGIFQLVENESMAAFNEWFDGKEEFTNVVGAKIQPRSIGDYTKRVAVRLASVERERIEQGGDAETLFSDRFEDESEVWAVGGVDLSK